MNLIRWGLLGAVLGLSVAVMPSCGGTGRHCDSTTCKDGCCDRAGLCQAGNSNVACGVGAGLCAQCGINEGCQAGTCIHTSGSSGGGSGSSGGGSASSGGGSSSSGGGSSSAGGGSSSSGGGSSSAGGGSSSSGGGASSSGGGSSSSGGGSSSSGGGSSSSGGGSSSSGGGSSSSGGGSSSSGGGSSSSGGGSSSSGGGSGCTVLSTFNETDGGAIYSGGLLEQYHVGYADRPGTVANAEDELSVAAYEPVTTPVSFTFDGGQKLNTCLVCPRYLVNCPIDGGSCERGYFATAGTATVTEVHKDGGSFKATFSNITFSEWSSGDAIVPGGRCIQLTFESMNQRYK